MPEELSAEIRKYSHLHNVNLRKYVSFIYQRIQEQADLITKEMLQPMIATEHELTVAKHESRLMVAI